jgi:hypothetical protein
MQKVQHNMRSSGGTEKWDRVQEETKVQVIILVKHGLAKFTVPLHQELHDAGQEYPRIVSYRPHLHGGDGV